MKIAICHKDALGVFSDRWIRYCERNKIDYKLVCAYDSNIIEQLADCDAFMWHFSNNDYKDALFAKQLIISLETAGKKVFPDVNTSWHFDDKVGEMYLLQSIGAPVVPSYVFYTKKDAMAWAESATYPKVFKLRGGSGASNVKLAKIKSDAKRYIRRAFSRNGYSQVDWAELVKFRFITWIHGRTNFIGFCKSLVWFVIRDDFDRMHPHEKGYAYFQEFIPNNTFDIRICVVDDKAFALKRLCREGDFRASGGGRIIYDKNQIDERCVAIALETSRKLRTQSLAYDFVFDENNNPLIVEISFGYAAHAYDVCEGYWDSNMVWHPGQNFDFCGWMVEEVIRNIEK